MAKRKKVDTREIGLVIALLVNRFIFGSDHLHYGLWTDDLEVDLHNLPLAQEKYVDFLLARIPEGTKSVLDVGAGTGAFASRLLDLGYSVDCVSPSPLLTERVRELVGDRSEIFEARFEEMKTDKKYDLVLFSESFQYIKMRVAMEQSLALLSPGGHMLICDFFRTEEKSRGVQGGGHKLSKWKRIASEHGLEPIGEEDITKETAPNITIFNSFVMELALPIKDLIFHCLELYSPRANRAVKWLFRKRLQKLDERYFSGGRSAESFSLHKTYRCLLYRAPGS